MPSTNRPSPSDVHAYDAWLDSLTAPGYADEPPAFREDAFTPDPEDRIQVAAMLATATPADVALVRRAFATGGMGLFPGEWAIIRDAYQRTAWTSVYGVKTAAEIHTAALDAAAVALRAHREAMALPPVCGGAEEEDHKASLERQWQASRALDDYEAGRDFEAGEMRGTAGHDDREGGF